MIKISIFEIFYVIRIIFVSQFSLLKYKYMNFNDFLALTPSEQKKTYENLREENKKLNNENKKLFQLSIQSISEEKKAELEKKIQSLLNEISEKNLLITKHQNEILRKDMEIRNSVSESEIALEE